MPRKLPPSHKLVQLNARINPNVNKKLMAIKETDHISKRQAVERAIVGYYRYRETGGEDYFKKVMNEMISSQTISRKLLSHILQNLESLRERDSRMLGNPDFYNHDE